MSKISAIKSCPLYRTRRKYFFLVRTVHYAVRSITSLTHGKLRLNTCPIMSMHFSQAPSRLPAQLNLAPSKTSASSYVGLVLQLTVTYHWRQLQILGESRTPFGVKSGGHSVNRGFSSTCGVQVSLARFNTFNVNTEAQTVELGPSLLWDDVYERLEPYGVTVIGGRIPEVGVGGLILGGGV